MERPYEKTLVFTGVGATPQTRQINLLQGRLKSVQVLAFNTSGALVEDALISLLTPSRYPVIDELTPARANHDPRNQWQIEYDLAVNNNDAWTVQVACQVSTDVTVNVVFVEMIEV